MTTIRSTCWYSLILLSTYFWWSNAACAQSTVPSPAVAPPAVQPADPSNGGIMHQLYLPQQVIKLGIVRYKDGEVLDGELSPDGMRVLIKNYNRRATVELSALFKDGTDQTITRSPCVIDTIPHNL